MKNTPFSDWRKKKFNETGEMPAAQPQQPLPYAKAARPYNPGGFNGTRQLGTANLTMMGQTLVIDSDTHSVNLQLTPQQVQQLMADFQ